MGAAAPRGVFVSLGLAALLLSAACGESPARVAEQKREIKGALAVYLPALAAAYATGDLSGLHGLAAEKEVAHIEKRMQDLAVQGKELVPELKSFAIEEVTVWGHANAYVTTVEVWDLKLFASGPARPLITEEVDQRRRYRYQLKREEGRWRVLFRTVQEP